MAFVVFTLGYAAVTTGSLPAGRMDGVQGDGSYIIRRLLYIRASNSQYYSTHVLTNVLLCGVFPEYNIQAWQK